MKQRTGNCDIDTFWEIVDEIGWGTKTTDTNWVEKMILESWDNEFIRSFRGILTDLRGKLASKVEAYEDANDVTCGCGDDGFSDLTHHVVGLGRKEYEGAMENPILVVNRGQKNDYVESFGYCIPYVRKAPKTQLSFEEALEVARSRRGPVREEDGDSEEMESWLKSEALEIMLGPKAKLDTRRYLFWIERDLPDLKALWHSEYAMEFAPFLVEIIGDLEQARKGDMARLLNPELPGKIAALRALREKVLREKEAELAVLRGRGHSLDNLVIEANQYLGKRETAA